MAKEQSNSSEISESDSPKRQTKTSKTLDAGDNGSAAEKGFCYATEMDSIKARGLKKMCTTLPDAPTVEDLMRAGSEGKIELKYLDVIQICWNPGKKGHTEKLQQVSFSVKDTLVTRMALSTTAAFTKEAAECIIDFCPDMLFDNMLLRITSETQFRNKEVRDRMCMNGNYLDKATITKRIGSALGQKQVSSPAAESSEERYGQNVEDYSNYQEFFGKGPTMRKTRLVQSGKRRAGAEDGDSSAVESRPGSSGSDGSVVEVKGPGSGGLMEGVEKTSRRSSKGKGKAKAVDHSQLDGAAVEDDEMSEVVGGKRKPVELDEVSLQSDGELDRLADD